MATTEKFPCQGPDLCGRCWLEVSTAKQWPSELTLKRRLVLTRRGLVVSMDATERGRGYWLPARQLPFLPSLLLTKFQVPPRPKVGVLTCGRQLWCSHFSCWDTGRYAMSFWFMCHEEGSIGRGVWEEVISSLNGAQGRHSLISFCLWSWLSASDSGDLGNHFVTMRWEPAYEDKPMCWGKQSRKSEFT